MNSFMDAKHMAKLLRQALAERNIELSHSDCLEIVARQFGLENWNILSAKIESATRADEQSLPEGWVKTGDGAAYYAVSLDQGGGPALLIESRRDLHGELRANNFCTVMQSISAQAFRGKRVRVSAHLRTENVQTGATLWFRINGPHGIMQFDNLEQRPTDGPLKGNTGWTERSVVFDVPEEALSLHFGFFTKGRGRCWARDFGFDEVSQDVPVNTSLGQLSPRPVNLTFGAKRH